MIHVIYIYIVAFGWSQINALVALVPVSAEIINRISELT